MRRKAIFFNGTPMSSPSLFDALHLLDLLVVYSDWSLQRSTPCNYISHEYVWSSERHDNMRDLFVRKTLLKLINKVCQKSHAMFSNVGDDSSAHNLWIHVAFDVLSTILHLSIILSRVMNITRLLYDSLCRAMQSPGAQRDLWLSLQWAWRGQL